MTRTTITERARIGARSFRKPLPEGAGEFVLVDQDLRGFRLRITATGATYAMSGRVRGSDTRRTVHIGDARTISATEARDKAAAIRADLIAGRDPVAEAAALARAEAGSPTFREVWGSYLPAWSAGRLARQNRPPRAASVATIKDDVVRALNALGAKPVNEIDIRAARGFATALEAEDTSNATKRKAWSAFCCVLDYAVSRGWTDANPARALPRPARALARDRVLALSEVALIWEAAGGLGEYGRLIRFLIALPLRRQIARQLRWDAVDLDARTVTIDAEAAGNKNRHAITLPLPPLARRVLEESPTRSGLVFKGAAGELVHCGARAKTRLDKAAGVTGWRVHDFRRTSATLTADHVETLDESAFDLLLQHRRPGIAGVYQRSNRLAAMRRAADQWDRVLAEIIGEADGAEVVAMRA